MTFQQGRPLHLWLSLVLLGGTLVGTSAAADERRTLLIVAHQDDDVSMAAEVRERIAAGEAVQTIYLTSGDASEGCPTYVQGREQGVKVLYASLSGIPGAADCQAPAQTSCWSE